MEVLGFGCGKLLLLGEHSAVYGYPAVGVPLPMKVTASLNTDYSQWVLDGSVKNQAPLFENLLTLVEKSYPDLKGVTGRLFVEGNVPRGSGLGSSAAFTAALAEVLLKAARASFSNEEKRDLAFCLEHQFHGKPSGIDTALSTASGPLAIYPDKTPIETQALPPIEGGIAFGYMKRSTTTRALVMGMNKRLKEYPDLKKEMEALGALAQNWITQAKGGSLSSQDMGKMAQEAQVYLKALGVSTPQLDAILNWGVNLGALGGKLSGAGGGGAFYFVLPTKEQAKDFYALLEKKGYLGGYL